MLNSDDDCSFFTHKPITDNLTLVREKYFNSGNRANLWVLNGEDRDIVIDTGLGIWDLPGYLRSNDLITDGKPVLALATHVHFDHSGGLHQFDKIGIHRSEYGALKDANQIECVTWLFDEEIVKKPDKEFRVRDYKVKAKVADLLLEDKTKISLGGDRELTVLHLPGHSRGSVGYLDSQHGLLFTGDVAYKGSLFDWLPYSNVNDYKRSFLRLKSVVQEHKINLILPGHGSVFQQQELIDMADQYINSANCCHKFAAFSMQKFSRIGLFAKNL